MRIENDLVIAAAAADSKSRAAMKRGRREEAAYFAGQAEALRLALQIMREAISDAVEQRESHRVI